MTKKRMTEFPRQASLGAQVLLLTEQFGQFKLQFSEFQGEIRNWMNNRQTKVTAWLPLIIVALGAFWYVMNLQNSSTNRQLADNVSRLEVTSAQNALAISKITEIVPTLIQQNADSKRDRDDQRMLLTKVLEVQTKQLADSAKETSLRSSKDAEIETQFRAMEGYSNLTRVYDNRMFALLWQQAYGTQFPVFQYYPKISSSGDGVQNE